MSLFPFLRRLYARLTAAVAPRVEGAAPVAVVAYPRHHCPRCGRLLAFSRHGEISWPHQCSEGYGVVRLDGTFLPRDRKREATILPEPIPLCPQCRAPKPCHCGYVPVPPEPGDIIHRAEAQS